MRIRLRNAREPGCPVLDEEESETFEGAKDSVLSLLSSRPEDPDLYAEVLGDGIALVYGWEGRGTPYALENPASDPEASWFAFGTDFGLPRALAERLLRELGVEIDFSGDPSLAEVLPFVPRFPS